MFNSGQVYRLAIRLYNPIIGTYSLVFKTLDISAYFEIFLKWPTNHFFKD